MNSRECMCFHVFCVCYMLFRKMKLRYLNKFPFSNNLVARATYSFFLKLLIVFHSLHEILDVQISHYTDVLVLFKTCATS